MAQKKKISLDAALDDGARDMPARSNRRSEAKRPARHGTVLIGAHVRPEFAKALKMLAVQEDTSNQQLIVEAVAKFLKSKGVKLDGIEPV